MGEDKGGESEGRGEADGLIDKERTGGLTEITDANFCSRSASTLNRSSNECSPVVRSDRHSAMAWFARLA
jgi:hypothetical protein